MSKEKYISIWRIRETGVSTLGFLECMEGKKQQLKKVCIEPTELFNLPHISCINEGEYWVDHHQSPTFGKCLIVRDVKDRTHVLFHSGNYFDQTEACILPGETFGYVNKDSQIDVKQSKSALNSIIEFVPEAGCKLIVRKVDNFQTVFGGCYECRR
jgi:hypothetical protein